MNNMLPSIVVPEYSIDLISRDGVAIKFRPYVVKEERVLLMALESGNDQDILNAVINLLQSCVITPGIDVASLPSYDVERLFLAVRSKAVGEKIDVALKHGRGHSCNYIHQTQIDVADIKLSSEVKENIVMLTDTIGVMLQHPPIRQLISGKVYTDKYDRIADCIQSVFDENNVYDQATPEELLSWLENLPRPHADKIVAYFAETPRLKYEMTWTCPQCGENEQVVFEGLSSFFGSR